MNQRREGSPPVGPAAWRPRILKREFLEVRSAAARVQADAETEAARILDEARSAGERLSAEAANRGFDAGLQQAERLVADLRARESEWLSSQEENLVRLSLKIARRILGRIVEEQPEAMVSLAREALKRARNERRILLKVHPDRLPALRGAQADGRLLVAPDREFTVQGDDSLPPDGCMMETELGVYRADPGIQLRSLEGRLKLMTREFPEREAPDGGLVGT